MGLGIAEAGIGDAPAQVGQNLLLQFVGCAGYQRGPDEMADSLGMAGDIEFAPGRERQGSGKGMRAAPAPFGRPGGMNQSRLADLAVHLGIISFIGIMRGCAPFRSRRPAQQGARFGGQCFGLFAEFEIEIGVAGVWQGSLRAQPQPLPGLHQLAGRIAKGQWQRLGAAEKQLQVIFQSDAITAIGVHRAPGRLISDLGRPPEGKADCCACIAGPQCDLLDRPPSEKLGGINIDCPVCQRVCDRLIRADQPVKLKTFFGIVDGLLQCPPRQAIELRRGQQLPFLNSSEESCARIGTLRHDDAFVDSGADTVRFGKRQPRDWLRPVIGSNRRARCERHQCHHVAFQNQYTAGDRPGGDDLRDAGAGFVQGQRHHLLAVQQCIEPVYRSAQFAQQTRRHDAFDQRDGGETPAALLNQQRRVHQARTGPATRLRRTNTERPHFAK